MEERNLLSAALSSREASDKLKFLLQKGDLTDTGQIVFDSIMAYYDNDKEARDVDKELLIESIRREFPKHGDKFAGIISTLQEISAPNVLDIFCRYKKEHVGMALSDAALSQDDNRVETLYSEYCKYATAQEEENDGERVLNNVDLHDIFAKSNQDQKVALYPKALNDALGGGVLPGTHILVYARPDCGKSQFAINQAAGSLREGKKVLYVGNEDPEEQMMLRLISRMTNRHLEEIQRDPEGTESLAREKGYENLYFFSANPGTFSAIRGQIDIIRPDVVIIDQLRNIYTGQDNKVLALEEAAIHARRIGKEYKVVVFSITQAGDSATNKLVLDMGDVDFSNTGIPAQVDLMIGLGRNEAFLNSNKLMLSIAKNKVNGEYTSIPVTVNRAISKLSSI